MSESLQENSCQVSDPGNEALSSPLHHFHLDRICFSSHTRTRTHNCRKKKKKIQTIVKAPDLFPEMEDEEEAWKDTLVLACPNCGFSALEGHMRSSGPVYSQGSREEKRRERVTEPRGRAGPRQRRGQRTTRWAPFLTPTLSSPSVCSGSRELQQDSCPLESELPRCVCM